MRKQKEFRQKESSPAERTGEEETEIEKQAEDNRRRRDGFEKPTEGKKAQGKTAEKTASKAQMLRRQQ